MAVFEGSTLVNMRTISFLFPEDFGASFPSGTHQMPTFEIELSEYSMNPIVEGRDVYFGSFEYTVEGTPPSMTDLSGNVTGFATERDETWELNSPEFELIHVKYQMTGFDIDIDDFRNETALSVLKKILSGDDLLSGGGTLLGFAGDDRLEGTSARDILDGGTGADTMIGGGGNDVFYVDHVGDVVIGPGQVNSSVSYVLPPDVYKLVLAEALAINGTGNDMWNFMQGSNGANELHGRRGNDTLLGRGGDDLLTGGNDDDSLTGGEGSDNLFGGTGADTFVFQWQEHSNLTSRDTIYDFSQAEGDEINLKAIDARVAAPGNQTFSFIGTDAFHNKAGELRYSIKEGKTYIHGDTDGDGAIDFSIKLNTVVNLTASDFIL